MRTSFPPWLVLGFALSTLFHPLIAQDGRYWTEQFGNKSMLLGGSVIGGVEDLGAVYYNPARLGLVDNPIFLLSADAFEWQRFQVFDAVNESGKESSSEFGGVPSLVAGGFRLGFLEGHQFAYSFLQRARSEFEYSFDDEIAGDVLSDFPGEESFRAALASRTRLREDWASISWAYPFNERYSIGVTMSGVRFNQRKAYQVNLHAHGEAGFTSLFTYDRGLKMDRFGLLWKVGLAAAYQRFQLGLTITTPMIGLFGSGSYQVQAFTANIPEEDDLYLTTKQEDLPTQYKRPLSIGAGVTYLFRQGKLHLAGEWFSRVPYYEMLRAEDHIGQSNGETYRFVLVEDLKGTINGAIGVEYYLGEKVSLFGSLATDFSVVDTVPIGFSERQPVANSSTFAANLVHLGGGLILKFKGIDLTLGVTQASGQETFKRPLDFPEEGNGGPVLPEDATGRLRWSRWRVVFGFEVPFLEKQLQQFEKKF